MSARSKPDAPAPEGEAAAAPPRRTPLDTIVLAELFTNLAHDLRSPLGVVSQVVFELRADFAAQLTDERRMLMDLAERGLLRLGRIADTLSFVAALESEDFTLRRHPVDLLALLRAAAAAASAIAPRREVTLSCELPNAPCLAAVDEEKLMRAFTEILVNAIRHARGRARVGIKLDAAEVRVAIEDDGQGVAVERHATLFRRLVASPSRSGLGLGLSIAHDVIVAHGGHLTLEASTLPPGRPGTVGARFVSSLPLRWIDD